MWGLHDWQSGHNGCLGTANAIAAYGAPANIEDFCRQAQMVNTEVFKAIYEAFNDRMWNDCTGVMIWMSNPAWPRSPGILTTITKNRQPPISLVERRASQFTSSGTASPTKSK